jgi:hypothetical protein
MDIYTKLYNDITNTLKHKDNKDFLNTLLQYFNYSNEFKNVIFINPELSLKILNRYNSHTQHFIESDETLENLLVFLKQKLISKTDTEEKKLCTQIDKLIYDYLMEQNFFQKCYDEKGIVNIEVTKKDVIDYKKDNPINLHP